MMFWVYLGNMYVGFVIAATLDEACALAVKKYPQSIGAIYDVVQRLDRSVSRRFLV